MIIPQEIQDQLIEHAQKVTPIEACGYLGGTDGKITTAYPMKNLDESGEHFTLDPAEQFNVIRAMREAGETALACYHSHPETPARPSQEDIKLAYDPNISYVIVSLAGETPDIKSFRIQNGQVEKEEIKA